MGCTQAPKSPTLDAIAPVQVPDIDLFQPPLQNDACSVSQASMMAIRQKSSSFEINVEQWQSFTRIGGGGVAQCFAYVHLHNAQLIAVKKVANQDAAEKEFKMLRELQHTNIVAVYRLNVCDIYMEYCTGFDLDTFCQKLGPINEHMISHILRQIADALHYLHDEKHVIHCDLKPKNLMISEQGSVKLIDFGSAVFVSQQSNPVTSINSNIEFTAIYAAPELILATELTSSVDIWSLGCIIIKMVSSTDPWSEHNFVNNSAAMFHIAKPDSYPLMPETFVLSSALQDVFKQCVIRDCTQRITASKMLKHDFFSLQCKQNTMPI